eukprot:29329-Pleurochrysis_carterae.AAC.1
MHARTLVCTQRYAPPPTTIPHALTHSPNYTPDHSHAFPPASAQSFPLLSLFLGDLCVLPLALMLLVAFAWALRYMPETVGKTLVQIQDELAGR